MSKVFVGAASMKIVGQTWIGKAFYVADSHNDCIDDPVFHFIVTPEESGHEANFFHNRAHLSRSGCWIASVMTGH